MQEFNSEPVIPIYTARPENVERALNHVYHSSLNALRGGGKDLELLIAILPDSNGPLYGIVNSFSPIIFLSLNLFLCVIYNVCR